MQKIGWLVATVAIVAAACTGSSAPAPEVGGDPGTTSTTVAPPTTLAEYDGPSYAGTDAAPEFPDGLDWLNVAQPLRLSGLEGKVVLLDFWTYGCINCIHIIPDLERLEEEYPDELVVIGVHSAKFVNESATENIRSVVMRYELTHPVVNDKDFAVWRAWGANAWPTVALIDPAGNAVGKHAGEGVYEVVQPIVAALVAEFAASIDRTPLELRLESDRTASTALSFPGKILADPDGERLFVADSGHHRIVVMETDGTVVAVYGSGIAGYDDGPALTARFNSPQGLALSDDGATLYVADTDNHVIRTVDVATGDVATLAGTGELGWPPQPGRLRETALNSPWALAPSPDGGLMVANAGTHQIWHIDPVNDLSRPIVGSAAEGTFNGPLDEAQLAQPSGLAFGSDGILYFADSESSSIRSADIHGGETALVAGGDAHLFEFGDIDGVGSEARLQHPLGIVWHDGLLIIADTYNSKIKTVDPRTGAAVTLFGREQGWEDGPTPRFSEPGGLSIHGDLLYVADTNNHAIRVIDLSVGTADTIVVKGIERFTPPPGSDSYAGTISKLEAQIVPAGEGTVVIDVVLPTGFKVNDEAPSSVEWSGDLATFPSGAVSDLTGAHFPLEFPVRLIEGEGSLLADLTLVYCREVAQSLCFIEQLRIEAPLVVGDPGPSPVVVLPVTIIAPEV